jgi:transcriptional regulator with XRE-family HTH domain
VDISDYLREAIRLRGWTVKQFAAEADVSFSSAWKWLSADDRYRLTPSPANCAKIAGALGQDTDVLLELAGHRSPRRRARAHVSAQRQAIRDQVDRWIAAVGEDHEEDFWDALKAHGDSTVALITSMGTAVKSAAEAPLSTGVNAQHPSRATSRRGTGSRLRPAQRCAKPQLTPRRPHPGYPQTPLRPPLYRLTPLHS